MKAVFTFLLVFFVQVLMGQFICPPFGSGNEIPDEPPGCTICGSTVIMSNEGATSDTTDYESCLEIENSLWFTYFENGSGSMKAVFSTEDCIKGEGLEMAIYDEDLNCLVFFSEPGLETGNIELRGLSPGKRYFIQLDGINGDVCDFTLVIQNQGGVPDPPEPIKVDPDTTLCPGAEVLYWINSVPQAISYHWSFPDNLDLIEGGGELDTFVRLVVREPGGGVVQVVPRNVCSPMVPAITSVVATPVVPSFRPPIFMCPRDFPFIFEGQEYYEFGHHEYIYQTALGCDSIVVFNLIPEFIFTEFNFHTCGTDFPIVVDNNEFYNYGEFEIIYPLDSVCDSVLLVEIVPEDGLVTELFEQICGEASCVQVGDSCFSNSGLYFYRFPNYFDDGCDSIVRLRLIKDEGLVTQIDTAICGIGNCFQIEDTCFTTTGNHRYAFEDYFNLGCDSLINIRLQIFDSVPSPKINYFRGNDGININWDKVPLADYYEVTIEKDSVFQTSDNFIIIPYSFGNHTFDVEIQPIGMCDYLPGEIIIFGSSSTNETPLSDKINIFPNPTSSEITIQTALPIDKVEVYDLSRKMVGSFQESKFFLPKELSGIFIVKIRTEEGLAYKKVILK